MLNTATASAGGILPGMVKRLPQPAHSTLLDGFGPRLKAARLALGHSGAEFARMIGASPQRLANWEAGTHPPETYMLAAIKHAGISIDYMLTGDLGSVSAKLLKGLLAQSAGKAERDVAGEARAIMREMPEDPPPTSAASPRRTLHEHPTPPPRRYLKAPDIQ